MFEHNQDLITICNFLQGILRGQSVLTVGCYSLAHVLGCYECVGGIAQLNKFSIKRVETRNLKRFSKHTQEKFNRN